MSKSSVKSKILNDSSFLNIVDDILNNKCFDELKYIEQHGTTRYLHSLKVAHLSYKIAKRLGLDYVATARAGLLHDFYNEKKEEKTFLGKLRLCIVDHAELASINSKELFKISSKEDNIIKSHMFPFGKTLPKHKESFIVDLVDDIIATKEFGRKYRNEISYTLGLIIVILKNSIS